MKEMQTIAKGTRVLYLKYEELHQKPHLNISIYQKEKIHWVF